MNSPSRIGLRRLCVLTLIMGFASGLAKIDRAQSDDGKYFEETIEEDGKKTRYLYPKKAKVDFTGSSIEGELKNPADFYFLHRNQEKFDSLVKRRPNFHREMLRDAVMSK